MTSRLAILALLALMLTNNVALAGVLWLDQSRAAAGMVEHADIHPGAGEQGGTDDHEHHATHCCHLQAHFQTISSDSGLMCFDAARNRWIPRSNTQSDFLIDSPPTPPPKA